MFEVKAAYRSTRGEYAFSKLFKTKDKAMRYVGVRLGVYRKARTLFAWRFEVYDPNGKQLRFVSEHRQDATPV